MTEVAIAYFLTFGFLLEGSVEMFTNRCFEAILDRCSDDFRWPSTHERIAIKRDFFQMCGIENCIGLGDGSLFKFENKPNVSGEDYFTRKGSSALSKTLRRTIGL